MGTIRTLGMKVLVGVVAAGIMLGGTAGLAGAASAPTSTAPAAQVAGGTAPSSKPHLNCTKAGQVETAAQRLQTSFTNKIAKLQKAEAKAQASAAKATTTAAKAYPDWLVKHYSRWIDRVKKQETFRLNARHLARMSHRAAAEAAACK
jgi:hypothetical protein